MVLTSTNIIFLYLQAAIFSCCLVLGRYTPFYHLFHPLKAIRTFWTVWPMRGGFSCILSLVIIPLGHRGRLPWGNLDILLNRKGFPIKVTMIGHPLLCQYCIHFPWDLGKYRLCNNILAPLSGNIESIFLERHFLVSLYPKPSFHKAYLATPLRVIPSSIW